MIFFIQKFLFQNDAYIRKQFQNVEILIDCVERWLHK